MRSASPLVTHEHPQDVLGAALGFAKSGAEVALVIVTATEGGAVRTPGALMAVSRRGDSAGYVSGGCIDADVRLNAMEALNSGQLRKLRYGAGSPFLDIRLPCGGAIEILIVPNVTLETIAGMHERLDNRKTMRFAVLAAGDIQLDVAPGEAPLFQTVYYPKLSLRIAGRGADCIALARLASASGLNLHLQLPDEADFEAVRTAGIGRAERLTTPCSLAPVEDDSSTAFVLMFHDAHWEAALLKQALGGSAFFIGAVGSAKTHAKRCESLRAAGMSKRDIQRIRGPVGLVPSMRDASMLAISTLAEIVDAFHTKEAVHV
ncbi:XdhC family protein [Hyphomonas sp.]|uniref:XdhC family protein n=1 Tax=Hyphomonas sp. TaxID=87 RepID=UPI0035644693